jgi:hypothetical protein
MKKNNCSVCKFWKPTHTIHPEKELWQGKCKRYPYPRCLIKLENDWCGEFKLTNDEMTKRLNEAPL